MLLQITPRLILFFLALAAVAGCRKDREEELVSACYPAEINEIIVTRCATAGCHNTTSKDAAGGLDLSTWDAMFNGTRNGAVTIPFSPEHSPLFFFINTDPMMGVAQQPTMPVNGTPLTTAEVMKVVQWINNGAPDCNGNIKFSNDPQRKKFYVANSGCDLVGVHDSKTKVVMRYVDVGNSAVDESLQRVRVSPDGNYWYASYNNSNQLYRFNTSDDSFSGNINIGFGNWSNFVISPDGTKAWIVDTSTTGKIAYADLGNMTLLATYSNPGNFNSPNGVALSALSNFLYVCGTSESVLYRWDLSSALQPALSIIATGNAQPYEVAFSPDGTKYFVTCRATNDVRVYWAANDSLMAIIPVADGPGQIVFNTSGSRAFISCEYGNKISVINTASHTLITEVFTGYQPLGIAIDDSRQLLYVLHRNLDGSGGPQPHHSSPCGGRNGYLTALDLGTLAPYPGLRMELSVDPVSITVRK